MVQDPLVALDLQANPNLPEISGRFPLNLNTHIERNPNLDFFLNITLLDIEGIVQTNCIMIINTV